MRWFKVHTLKIMLILSLVSVLSVAPFSDISYKASAAQIPEVDVTFTDDADFDRGTLINVNYARPNNNQLLSDIRVMGLPPNDLPAIGVEVVNQIKADIVFIVDATSSMSDEIAAVKNGLGDFVTRLDTAAVDARFALVLYGGAPELVLDFTSSGADTEAAFDKISVSGRVNGFQNYHDNPEAGLEAIRMVLGESSEALAHDNVNGDDLLQFRTDARKILILVTDEDSDRPFFENNRHPGQISEDPPGDLSDTEWQTEIDNTAQAIIDSQAFVNLVINPGDSPSRFQYGDPDSDVSDTDLLNFDRDATLTNLVNGGFGNSLQAQVLQAGLIARSFNISRVNDPDFVNNFFAAKTLEIVENPPMPPPNLPTTGTQMNLSSERVMLRSWITLLSGILLIFVEVVAGTLTLAGWFRSEK